VYGTDPVPTGAANWIEARNVNFTPADTELVARNIEQPYLDEDGQIIVAQWAKLTFDIAVAPSGVAGTAPKWGALLLACAMAETTTVGTSVTYNMVSDNLPSATMYINMSGVLHKLLGVRGDVQYKGAAKGIPMFTFTFDCLYSTPTDAGMPVVTKTGWMLEEAINATNTGPIKVNGVDLAYSQFDWGLGNKVSRINLPGPHVEVQINSRKATASATVIAVPAATLDPFALMASGTLIDVSATHGTVAGKKVKTDIKARISNVAYADIDGMTGWNLTFDPVPVVGNDTVALTLL
jgi:hypothetical protein